MSPARTPPYADFIKNLPKAKLAVEGPVAHLLAAPQGQVVFFELPAGSSVPPHSHGAQWGIMVEGDLELTIGEETLRLKPGDSYYIPAGVTHSARVLAFSRAVDVFAEADRYAAK